MAPAPRARMCWMHMTAAGCPFAGVAGWPFDVGPREQAYVASHDGECKKACAAPWHLSLVEHRRNTLAGQWVRSHRGKYCEDHNHKYGYHGPPNWQNPAQVRVGWVVG